MNKLIGWKEVYGFTLKQSLKGKAVRITTLILILISLASVPAMNLLGEKMGNAESKSDIQTVYVVDDTGLGIQGFTDSLSKNENYSHIKFVTDGRSADEITKQFENEKEKKYEVLLHITYENSSIQMKVVNGTNSGVSEEDAQAFMNKVNESFQEAKMKASGVDASVVQKISQPIDSETVVADAEGNYNTEKASEGLDMSEYYIILAGIVLLIFVVAFSGEAISSSIVTEKSTRVIEYLMTSIKPMAEIVGKVLASVTVVLLQFLLIGVSVFLSFVLSKELLGLDKVALPTEINDLVNNTILPSLSVGRVLVILLVVLTGVLFYGVFAGLFGATVSKIEEMAEGMKLYNLILIFGAYMGIALCIMQLSGSPSKVFEMVVYLLPFTSPFIIPTYLLLGKISLATGLLALGILAISVILLSLFVAKVFESLILYNGSTLKFKQVLALAKKKKSQQVDAQGKGDL